MSRAVVVDTNVLVAGLLTSNIDAPTVRILDGMMAAAFPFVVSDAVIAEYRDVLNRPKLHKLHGLDDTQVETVLVEIVSHAIVLAPVPAPPAPDPGDQHLWELLYAREDLILVTGDKRLVESGMKSRILTPAQFLAD